MSWISVKDRLPEKGEFVLVNYSDPDERPIYVTVTYGEWEGVEWVSCESLTEIFGEITHWLPLSEIPLPNYKKDNE